jgi:hypothetical protein
MIAGQYMGIREEERRPEMEKERTGYPIWKSEKFRLELFQN